MSTLRKRVAFYLFGVILGGLIVFFLFGSRSDIRCNYFPSARVLSNLAGKTTTFNELAQCQKECLGLDSLDVYHIFAAGEVDFNASEPRRKPFGYYVIQATLPDRKIIHALVENRDSVSLILDLQADDMECSCD